MRPTLSVITICFNNLAELQATCRSVDAQTHVPEEHLLIDGSKNQEILEWLTGNEQPTYRRWIHEKDEGISDAFNKGIRNAKGTLTHLLNSGDRYADIKAIETMLQVFENDPALKWAHSQYVQHRGDMDLVSGVPFDKNQLWKGMRTVAHPSMFIKKELYDRHGLYKTDYRIAMDYDFLVRIRNEKNQFIPKPLVYFAPGGASNLQFSKGLAEVKKSYKSHIGKSFMQDIWQLRQRLLHSFMNTRIGKNWFQRKNANKKVIG